MNRTNQLTKIHLSGKPYIIYKSQNGFDLYTDFSKKIILNSKNIKILCPKIVNKEISNLKKLILCFKILINSLKKNKQNNTVILSLQNSSLAILIAKFFKFKIIIFT